MSFVPVVGYPGYQINRDGVVIGKFGRPLRPRPQHAGRIGNLPYHVVAMYDGHGGRKDRFVHHLVLETFVGPRPEGMEARHLNSDVSDNRLENLAWGTREENGRDKVLRRTHCKVCGGELAGNNLMMVSNGKRRVRKCKTCHSRITLAGYHRRKNANA